MGQTTVKLPGQYVGGCLTLTDLGGSGTQCQQTRSTAAPLTRSAARSRSAASARSSGYGVVCTVIGMPAAAGIPITVHTTPYPLDRADAALRDLAADRVNGAAVLRVC